HLVQHLARLGVPDAEQAALPGRDALAVAGPPQWARRLTALRPDVALIARGRVPEAQRAVLARRGQGRAARRPAQPHDGTGMALERLDLPAALEVPQPDRAVVAAGGEEIGSG